MKCVVSVIVPVFNIQKEYLDICIESILNQSIKEIEIFIIDDGSEKSCADLCDTYKSRDERVRIIHQQNQGVSVCRNLGIEKSSGEWIAFIDGDDWVECDYLERLVKKGMAKNADIILCDCYIEYNRRREKVNFFSNKELNSNICGKDRFILQFLCPKILHDGNSVTDSGAPWAKLYNSNFIKNKTLLFDTRLRRMQDNIFNLYAYEKASCIYYFSAPLYHYRKNISSGFQRYNPQIIEIYQRVFTEILSYIKDYKKNNYFKEAFYYKVFFSIYVILKTDFIKKENMQTFRQQKIRLNILLDSQYYFEAIQNINKSILSKSEKFFLMIVKIRSLMLMKLALYSKELIYNLIGKGVKNGKCKD